MTDNINLFQLGDFTLNSGAKSKWKLECDALTESECHALAVMIRQLVGPFCHCVGVPRGGLRLQNYLSPMATDGPVLIVDDVLTTGGSMEREKELWRREGDRPEKYPAAYADVLRVRPSKFTEEVEIVGAVVFARGKCPSWIKVVFQLPECFWLNKDQTK